jgi:hypothetical protein
MWVVTPAVLAKSRQADQRDNLGLVIAEVQQAAAVKARVLAAESTANCSHRSRLLLAIGSSRASRFCCRHQPQLRLDCSAPIRPFSTSTTETRRLGQVVGGEHTDDAPADHHDIGGNRGF